MSNEKKYATLGMPYGTANGRLRKNILFHLLKKHNENVCVRCCQPILVVEDLSIEHIKPWEGISADLFWDLENVAFSHLSCNVPHTYHGGEPQRKIGPEGTSWCGIHQNFISNDLFYKKANRWNGFGPNCKSCHDIDQGHGVVRGRVSKQFSVGG